MDRAVMQALFMVQKEIEELKKSRRTVADSMLNDISVKCREIMRLDRDELEEKFDDTAIEMFAYGIKNIDKILDRP